MNPKWEGEPLWGEVNSYQTFNSLLNLYRSNELDQLKAQILQSIETQTVFPILLIGTKWNEEGISEDFIRWVIQQKELFPKSREHLDLGLRTSLFKWRPDGVELFTELGADPNQQVLPETTLLDIAMARDDFAYHCEEQDELERTIAALSSAGGKHYLEIAYQKKLACQSIFANLALHDSWAERIISDLSDLDLPTQELIAKLLSDCLNKAKNPSKKWWASTMQIINDIGQPVFLDYLKTWLLEACEPRKSHVYGYEGSGHLYRYSYMSENLEAEIWKVSEKTGTQLKSLLWLTKLMDEQDRFPLLSHFSESMFTTYYNRGVRDAKLAMQSFSLMIEMPEGKLRGLEMRDQCAHKPSIKKMTAVLEALDQ